MMSYRHALVAGVLAVAALPARAEHLDQRTQEIRTVLYYAVPDAALAQFLPAGWHAAPLASGPAKGANLTVNLSEQLGATDAAGHVAGDARGRAMTISARVHDSETSDNRAMVLFGITTGPDAPGPYGRHHKGTVALTRHSETAATGPTHETEQWAIATAEGDRFDLSLGWARGDLVAGHSDQQTRSSLHPDFYRIYKVDAYSDVVRSRSGNVDHAEKLQISAAGQVQALLAAAGEPVAIISVPAFHREIWLP